MARNQVPLHLDAMQVRGGRPANVNQRPPRFRRLGLALMLILGWGYLVFLATSAFRLFNSS